MYMSFKIDYADWSFKGQVNEINIILYLALW